MLDDDPKLDELKRLLRRLEKITAAPEPITPLPTPPGELTVAPVTHPTSSRSSSPDDTAPAIPLKPAAGRAKSLEVRDLGVLNSDCAYRLRIDGSPLEVDIAFGEREIEVRLTRAGRLIGFLTTGRTDLQRRTRPPRRIAKPKLGLAPT